MCFTVSVNIVREELESRYGRVFFDHERYRPSYYYHAFSLPELPVILPDSVELMQWGLIPSWTESVMAAETIRMKTFNARSETISGKPSFREPFRSKRCIIPVSGFFEWQKSGPMKIPWYISSSVDEMLSLGGVWDEWMEPEEGRFIRTFSVLTTEANELMSKIHNTAQRMPLILEKGSVEQWLLMDVTEGLSDIMVPCPSELLSAHTVSPLISKRNEDRNQKQIIAHYDYYKTGTLFD